MIGDKLRAYANKDGRGYPDWALRYVPVVNRLRKHTGGNARILEIGANENGFARFAKIGTIAVDIEPESLRAARAAQKVLPVLADIGALPFADKSIDVCVCMDTFEHLPAEKREAASGEIMRVMGETGAGVVGFPSGDGALDAERGISLAYKELTGGSLHWLDEHSLHGLPDPDKVCSVFRQLGDGSREVTLTSNAPLWIWKIVFRILLCGWPGRGNAFFQALLRLITPVLCLINSGRCYRSMVWIEPKERCPDSPRECR